MKRVLVVHYSQTEQLTGLAERVSLPLMESADIEVTFECVQPVEPFPFPWPFFRFFDAFPESVYLDPTPIEASNLSGDEEFDLIIFAYQVWFLSPSLPMTAFLQSELAKKLLNGKPVITLIACRDMWLMAQEEVKTMLSALDARLIGNIAFVDDAGSAGSFIATPLWVLTGNKGPRLGGLIPRAGVSERNIEESVRFGERIASALTTGQSLDNNLLKSLGAVQIKTQLIPSEKIARRSFRIWGALIRAVGPSRSNRRKPVLVVYVVFLLTLILTVVPLTVLIRKLLSPFLVEKKALQKVYFSAPSGE